MTLWVIACSAMPNSVNEASQQDSVKIMDQNLLNCFLTKQVIWLAEPECPSPKIGVFILDSFGTGHGSAITYQLCIDQATSPVTLFA